MCCFTKQSTMFFKVKTAIDRGRESWKDWFVSNKGSKGWTPKSIDVDAAQWKRVKVAADAEAMELRVWLWRAIRHALGEEEVVPKLRPPATVTKLGGIVVMEGVEGK